jgi:hypothetical protein
MNETVTVINHAKEKLRISVKLAEWTQDENGKDIYKDSNDLIYFRASWKWSPRAGGWCASARARRPA